MDSASHIHGPGAIKVDLPSLPVVYSTPSAAAVADFVSTHYDLLESINCRLLYRGWNDIFDVRTKDGKRFVFRISKRRAPGDADVASETEFLAYLDGQRIPVAAAVPMRDGSLFTSAIFPEGERPAVLFHYAGGRPSRARSSICDARANGATLARMADRRSSAHHQARGRRPARSYGHADGG
jgi:Ser/Thr protein kinase RdoA (MazF antagonist)